METGSAQLQLRLGSRISEARTRAGLTQTALADRVGMERTQLVRVERGERKVTVGELAGIAGELGVPIDWFISDGPPAVLSRRSDGASAHITTVNLDVAVDRAARDVALLMRLGRLRGTAISPVPVPASHSQAESLANQVRARLALGDEPIADLGAAVERAGVVWFSEALGEHGGDGACVEVASPTGRLGVAVINGTAEPGRRRWTLAHELGHFLVGDAYATDHPAGDIERYIDSFVAHLLMPRTGVGRVWAELSEVGAHRVALAISSRFQTSWSAACGQLATLRLIDDAQRRSLLMDRPTQGDYLATGETWNEDLIPPALPAAYVTAVLNAYIEGDLSADRAIELLRFTLTVDSLPSRTEDGGYPSLPS